MRILSKRQLKELVLYSPQHIARLEKVGQFPKRVTTRLRIIGTHMPCTISFFGRRSEAHEAARLNRG